MKQVFEGQVIGVRARLLFYLIKYDLHDSLTVVDLTDDLLRLSYTLFHAVLLVNLERSLWLLLFRSLLVRTSG